MGVRNEKVFALLKEQNKKSAEVAEILGLSKSAITYWKKNGTDPTYEQCMKLAPFFGVSVEYLWNDEKTEHENTFPIDTSELEGKKKQLAECLNAIYNAGEGKSEEDFELIYRSVMATQELIQALKKK